MEIGRQETNLFAYFDEFVEKATLNVDDQMRGAAQFDLLELVDPLAGVGAELADLQAHLLEALSLDVGVGQLD